MQEHRRHARVVKKASKLAVSELLEIAAMKGMTADMAPADKTVEQKETVPKPDVAHNSASSASSPAAEQPKPPAAVEDEPVQEG